MSKVVVTGGAGFIGSHIAEELVQAGYEVIVIDNFSTGHYSNIAHLPIEIYEYDITNPAIIDFIAGLEPAYIIHQAAQVSVAESVYDILHDENVNVKGSLHIIKAAVKASVQKLVFASSAAVYGNPLELPVTVEHPTLPESPYGLTKLTVEKYLKMANKFYQLSYGILRYSNVYGPRQDAKGEGGVVSIFSEKIQTNNLLHIYGDGEQTRDFIYVKDVARANIKALEITENLCVNISSNTKITINDLWRKMKKAADIERLEIKYERERAGDIRHSILCNQQAMKLLNWTPETQLENGLKETLLFATNNLLQELK
ncbi:NAD-dependent epimerase/dehydratase family protein [Niallia nealsonii]|uniref:UDP-glucose 4-epimerase n=1 Tax=Niallia nealsonii TaxID=115979 RepID=A0A2N0YYE9_9BACI|nr:NAD-dependent epimerase/dehydratase family protein [Niallia nealsonii]PKG22286.1 UDP-glucose 4-epimerase [Niallia nealsonii]